VSRIAARRLALAAIAATLAVAIFAGVFRRDIDAAAATAIADRLRVQYHRGSGESPANFGAREMRIWADGWEFRWRYRPCVDFASLRIWVSRDGRLARYVEQPDCAPVSGFAGSPLKV